MRQQEGHNSAIRLRRSERLGNGFFGYFVFEDPNWDFRTLNFTSDVALTDENLGPILNATDPDLRPLREHGAKIIHYVGWADSAIAPANSINYYDSVRAELPGVDPGRGDLFDPCGHVSRPSRGFADLLITAWRQNRAITRCGRR